MTGTLEHAMTTVAAPEHPALPVSLEDVEEASRAVEGAVKTTAFDKSETLSQMTGANLFLKMENQQFTASYKERGALNRLTHLGADERRAGVIAMSAGNHAQAVAHHARKLGIPAVIVMPADTPTIKVEGTRSHGAEVVLHGQTLEESAHHAHQLAAERGLTFVHPFDDPRVIAGQGTVALEMIGERPGLDTVLVPVGGGGLISGMAVALKARRPEIEIIGVQAELYPAVAARVKGEEALCGGDTLAEGIAVKQPGELGFAIIEALVDDVVLVSEIELERAVSLLLTIEKTVVEGAGAAGLAAVLADPERYRGRNVGLVVTGGNIDTRLLAEVLARELAREGRLARIRVEVKDRPGQLADITRIIAECGGNIVEVSHQRVFTRLPAKGAYAMFEVETRDRTHLNHLITEIKAGGYTVQLLEID